MSKLPVGVENELARIQVDTIPHLASIIVRKDQNCEHLPEWFKEKDISYYEGLLDANYSFIESMLKRYNCYNGFSIVKVKDVHVKKYDISYQFYSF